MKHAALIPLAIVIAIGLSGVATPGLAQDGSAGDVVRDTADRVLRVLRTAEISSDERRRRIEEIVYGQFDFETVHQLVLGRYWRVFSETQRRAFAEEFRRHLVLNYGDRIDRYNQEALEIVGERAEARGDVTVRTRISGGAADGFNVNYRMRKRDGHWLVIDVVIEGVSVLKSYRSQFGEMLGRTTPQGLIDQLREKNVEKERAIGTTPPPSSPAQAEDISAT